MPKSPRTVRKRIIKENDDGSVSKQLEEKLSTIRRRSSHAKSPRPSSDTGRRSRRSLSDNADNHGDAPVDDNANNKPNIANKMKPEMTRSKEAEKTDGDKGSDTKNGEDCNNHGCTSYPPPCSLTVAPGPFGPRSQIMCCSSQPNAIKITAKLIIFLLVLASIFYALFLVAANWRKRNEVLTLLLLLLGTRMVCKNNWFLPTQYWRNLDPACDTRPRQVDVTVPSQCPYPC